MNQMELWNKIKKIFRPSFSSDPKERGYEISVAQNMCDCNPLDPPSARSLASQAKINMIILESMKK